MRPTLLLAGMGPHPGIPDDVPSSADLAEAVAKDWDTEGFDLEVVPLRVPCAYEAAGRTVRDALDAHAPDLFLLVDVDPTSPDHVLHVLAANWDDSADPDTEGTIRREHIIDPDGPVAYRNKLPLDGIWDKFVVERIPLRIGHKAGGHVFNHAYFHAMRHIDQHGLGTLGGAVQVPPTPAYAQAAGSYETLKDEGEGPRSYEAVQEEVRMMVATIRRLYVQQERARSERRF